MAKIKAFGREPFGRLFDAMHVQCRTIESHILGQ